MRRLGVRAGAVAAFAALLMLLPILSQGAEARPGDVKVSVRVSPGSIEATPTDAASSATFAGNLSLTQPFYQRATVDLTATTSRNWTATVSPARIVGTGTGTDAFSVIVTVPASALAGDVATLTVTAKASTRFNTNAESTTQAMVRVRPWMGYWVNASDPIVVMAPQGTSGTFGFTVRNVGNVEERYAVSAPYWYGLQRYGVTVEPPQPLAVRAHSEAGALVTFTVRADTVPRVYEVRMLVDAWSMPDGGTGAGQDPKWARAWINVTGLPPADDPYSSWTLGGGPASAPQWRPLFGSSERRGDPDVDPSGRTIVYSQSDGGGGASIYAAATDGSTATPLTHGDHLDECPVISPDGARVAFLRDGREVVVVSINGTVLDTLPTGLKGATLTDWSPTGDRLLLDAGGDVLELELRTNLTRPLAGEPVDQWGATYSSDGGRIFYLSHEAAGPEGEVFSMAPDGSDHRQLTFDDLGEDHVSISPNGQRVAFSLEDRQSGGERLCVMSTDGTAARWFTDAGARLGPVRWMPDGRSLVAEVHPVGGLGYDLELVAYPWKDAGAGGGGGGGGDGSSGGGGGNTTDAGPLGPLLDPMLWAVVVIAAAAIAGGALGVRWRRRSRAEAADRLKAITGKGVQPEGPDGPATLPGPAGPPGVAAEASPVDLRRDYAVGYDRYDGSGPPPEPAPAVPRVVRREG